MSDLAAELFEDLLEALEEPEAPARRLATVKSLLEATGSFEAALGRRRRAAILEARDQGATWRQIGEWLGVSAQRAERLGRATARDQETI